MNKLRDSGFYEKLARDLGSRPSLPDPAKIAKTFHSCWFVAHSSFRLRVGIYSLYRGTFYVCASGLCSLYRGSLYRGSVPYILL